MRAVEIQESSPTGLSPDKILAQVELMTQDDVFRSNKRSIAFLKYVVTEALNGAADQIKERTIGIEVFGINQNQWPAPGGYVETPDGQGWFIHFQAREAHGRIGF